ncbi:UDP-3-O-(3-hydroxymyristoyl)glucosamine N-acyltransferase [Hydrogenophaga crassostreae]|uniref:UDP-3-O-acylglucosamine N-acyltransferase n=1 Tax=Hydrogenophaga crassostreae TaxID=1763535 RepID=A0A167IEM7_9BURK|nr:UDP-3-O-(3-hydroxymyristoyl)glucosamine N-acyltransferase [Hydrogenophaga crassostreae]AOW13225.1 UDP-3-O-(3-hydroxymyristoyl)glucosamine N-acyltransferase [Hydrogenophaga crassostreae]OAD42627.1 UDP-3-O-(3-hydroxymyristoyl)glucosamine N-acyltransferase [Hydrogenophaga crassostreae]
MPKTLGSVVEALGGELFGDALFPIMRLAPIASARGNDLAFVAQARYAHQIESTQAGALIVPPALKAASAARGACIVTDDPYLYFARLTQWWRATTSPAFEPRIHPQAFVDPKAVVEPGVEVGPFSVIEAGAHVSTGARIGAHCTIGAGARIGRDTRLSPNVTVGADCQVGERCIFHSGVVIGADGFGFAPHKGQWIKIEQLGAVRIGHDVEIGANTCVDRGALDDTVIEDGVKLDNLIQIGHNVHIGAHSAMAGCVGVAGSAIIGAHCTVGGGAIVLGHLTLADRVNISAGSVVTRSINKPGHYTGMFPIDDNASWEKNAASLKQLNRLRERLKAAEQAIAQAMHNKPMP